MLARRRAVIVGVCAGVLALGGGAAAWAGSGAGAHGAAGSRVASAITEPTVPGSTAVNDSSTSTPTSDVGSTEPETSTTIDVATSVPETSTSVDLGTSVPENTSTSVAPESTTTVPETPTTMPCKPGWGYGDTNHCHSGPPGLAHRHPGTHGH